MTVYDTLYNRYISTLENSNVHYLPLAQSVQHWAMGSMIRVLGSDSWWGMEIFLFTAASRMALGPTQPPIQ
jgi:hypothetical protein